jgi:protein phosphatase PTC7
MYTNTNDMTAIGVADGVGGWGEYGVDPSIISYQIMQNCKTHFSKNLESDDGKEKLMEVEKSDIAHPKQVLIDSYNMLFSQRQVEAGSTTACVVTIDGQLRVSYANLGDSGFLVVRPSTGETVFRSKEQQHCKYLDLFKLTVLRFQCSLPTSCHSSKNLSIL